MTTVASDLAAPVIGPADQRTSPKRPVLMLKLKRIGIQPGREVTLAVSDDGVRVTSEATAGDAAAELPREIAAHVFVARP